MRSRLHFLRRAFIRRRVLLLTMTSALWVPMSDAMAVDALVLPGQDYGREAALCCAGRP